MTTRRRRKKKPGAQEDRILRTFQEAARLDPVEALRYE